MLKADNSISTTINALPLVDRDDESFGREFHKGLTTIVINDEIPIMVDLKTKFEEA